MDVSRGDPRGDSKARPKEVEGYVEELAIDSDSDDDEATFRRVTLHDDNNAESQVRHSTARLLGGLFRGPRRRRSSASEPVVRSSQWPSLPSDGSFSFDPMQAHACACSEHGFELLLVCEPYQLCMSR